MLTFFPTDGAKPRSQPDGDTNNPYVATQEFVALHPEFVLEQAQWLFNQSNGLTENITYSPGTWLRRS